MRCSILNTRLPAADNRAEPSFMVHVFVYGQTAEAYALPFQIYFHTPISINSLMFMIDGSDFVKHLLFPGMISRLPVFQEVVVSVWHNHELSKKPAHAEDVVIFLNKPISL